MIRITRKDPRIWLASASPRRRELLRRIGFEPIVRAADVIEVRESGELPGAYASRLAREKGRFVRGTLQTGPSWVLAADTVVVIDGQVLEKPEDEGQACALLGKLSGREHEVVTAYWVGDVLGSVERADAVTTSVRFRQLSSMEIRAYVRSGEPMDKAGAYGIQGIGGVFVAGITGSYSNVVGLPVEAVVLTLRDLGALGEFPFA